MAGELPPPPPHAQRSKITTDQIPSRTICDKANMLCYPAPTEPELLRATIARSPKQSTEGVPDSPTTSRRKRQECEEIGCWVEKRLIGVGLVAVNPTSDGDTTLDCRGDRGSDGPGNHWCARNRVPNLMPPDQKPIELFDPYSRLWRGRFEK